MAEINRIADAIECGSHGKRISSVSVAKVAAAATIDELLLWNLEEKSRELLEHKSTASGECFAARVVRFRSALGV